ncbi:MAG: hypothetical protein ACETWG_10525 [Candidatus Neomarinimicrobiota bacterium]
MEIKHTLLQGLLQTVTEGLHQPQQAPGSQLASPVPDQMEASPELALDLEPDYNPARSVETENNSSILTSGEKEIIELFFNDQSGVNAASYGARPPKPTVLGNFVDVKG